MNRHTSLIALLAVFLLLPATPEFAHAKTGAPVCTLTPQAFAPLQKSRRESPDAVREELETRKALLLSTLDCLDEEVKGQRTELVRTRTTSPRMQSVRNNLLLALEEAARYYSSWRESIRDAGLRAAKDAAANIREWRTNTFLPQHARIRAFISWARNEEFLTTASKRLEELERGVQVLALVDHAETKSLYERAEGNFRAAQDFHSRAEHALVSGLDPSPSLKLSLEALAATYTSFIELSNTINALLPPREREKVTPPR
jgi:hypothetical protein